jgi:glycosyltransferase involved in cell wall biosynthesis
MPLVSVYIPTLSRLELLKRALSSVLAQSMVDFEVIVVDDGSSDGTLEYLAEIGCINSKVKYISNSSGKHGACRSRNIAIHAASGKFVAGLDDDDYFHPNRLEILISNYKKEYGFVASNHLVIGAKGVSRSSFFPRIVTAELLLTRNAIGSHALIERSRIIEVGGYDEELRASQDVDLWVRLIDKFGPALRVAKPLYFMDVSHDLSRISTSSSRDLGTSQFIRKHGVRMTPSQIRFRNDFYTSSSKKNSAELYSKAIFNYSPKIIYELVRTKLKLG